MIWRTPQSDIKSAAVRLCLTATDWLTVDLHHVSSIPLTYIIVHTDPHCATRETIGKNQTPPNLMCICSMATCDNFHMTKAGHAATDCCNQPAHLQQDINGKVFNLFTSRQTMHKCRWCSALMWKASSALVANALCASGAHRLQAFAVKCLKYSCKGWVVPG